jgi:hypothetical protein
MGNGFLWFEHVSRSSSAQPWCNAAVETRRELPGGGGWRAVGAGHLRSRERQGRLTRAMTARSLSRSRASRARVRWRV